MDDRLAESGPAAAGADDGPEVIETRPDGAQVIKRHALTLRITHWINLLAILILLMSGLQIFNAHPRLYWGQYGADPDPAVFEMAAEGPRGVTRIGGLEITTTGLFGVSMEGEQMSVRGFPQWATLPSYTSLAKGRNWHFFFAWVFVINGLIYLIWAWRSRHLQRDIWPTRDDLKGTWQSIVDHVRLKHPTGEAAKRYNVLQRLAYLVVIGGLLPLMLLTGLSMSPGFNAFAPWLVDVLGGRQSARTLHFISATGIVLFVIVHVVEVFLAGFVNEMRSMITGRYVVPPDHPETPEPGHER